jgi:hypothetical protein
MKKIKSIALSKSFLKNTSSILSYKIQGDTGAVFSLQVKDSSSPNKFYNFETNTFTNTFTSENTLSNVVLSSNLYESSILIPDGSSGNEYRFLVFAEPIFNTEIVGENSFFLKKDITQKGESVVRFSTSSDQTASNFVGLGTNVGSITGNSGKTANSIITVSDYSIADSGDGTALGYKFSFSTRTKTQKVAADKQPIDSDFFTSQSKTTSGSGSSATAMVLTNIDNLAVGMSLISITSSTVTTSGSLGVLTFPTITAIDTDTNTVTLSSAHSWADNKAVVFRAYGSDLIRKSTGGVFSFNNFTVEPSTQFGTVVVNGTTAGNTTVVVDALSGISIDSRIFGAGVDTTDDNNKIENLSSDGLTLTMGGNQEIKDNVPLKVLGSSTSTLINGEILISTFPSISTDIFYDIDRSHILATTA